MCFLCSNNKEFINIGTSDCPQCSPTVTLDLLQGQHVLEHIGAHILHDLGLDQSISLHGLCLCPPPLCQFFLRKGKGTHANLTVDQVASKGCLIKIKCSYSVASESTNSLPCTNAPIHCPLCPKSEPVIWRYFLKVHFQEKHPNIPFMQYKNIWKLTNFEIMGMKHIWANQMKVTVKCTKMLQLPPLTISEDHCVQVPATRYFVTIVIPV